MILNLRFEIGIHGERAVRRLDRIGVISQDMLDF
jgi:hypothetical protein